MRHQWLNFAIALALVGACADCDKGPTGPNSHQTRIAFTSPRGVTTRVWVMNSDGSSQIALTPEGDHSLSPSWSPSGAYLLFTKWWVVGGTSVLSGIFRMKADGSNVVCLDTIPDTYYETPRYSPDETRILVGINNRIWVLNADGSNPVNLTPNGEQWQNADWSPDGARIIFTRATPMGVRIYTMKSDGTDTVKVYEPGTITNQLQPRISPNGAAIVYVDDHGGFGSGTEFTWIHVMNADGTNARPISPPADGKRSEPCWSPDGLRLAYRDDIYPAEIFTMNPDGTDVVNVSNYPNAHDINPAWGPAAP